jgi:hypothetical protein
MNFIKSGHPSFFVGAACWSLLVATSLFWGMGGISLAQEKDPSRSKETAGFVTKSAPSTPTLGSSHHIVSLAPDVHWKKGNNIDHLASLRGRPVLILFTDTPLNHAFRHQLRELQSHYERLAAHGLICAVAFTQEIGPVPSNIPFITLLNGEGSARAYGISQNFGIALLGADGNLDCLSTHPLSGQRIEDLMNASYTVQEIMRKP